MPVYVVNVCMHTHMYALSIIIILHVSTFLFIPLIKIINIDMDLKLIAKSQCWLPVGARNAQWSLVMT